jgi:hypothetical protein
MRRRQARFLGGHEAGAARMLCVFKRAPLASPTPHRRLNPTELPQMSELSIRHMPVVRFTKRALLGLGRVRADAGLIVTRVLDILDCNAALTFNRQVPEGLGSIAGGSAGGLVRSLRAASTASIITDCGVAALLSTPRPASPTAATEETSHADEVATTAVVDNAAQQSPPPSATVVVAAAAVASARVSPQILTYMRRLQRLCEAVGGNVSLLCQF